MGKHDEDWSASQKKLQKKKIIEKLCKAGNQSIYTTKLLQSCKQWSGPATSVTELEQILQSHPDIQERIVRVELACYRDTHKSEVIYNTDLCKINKVTHEERLTNFCVLLQGFSHHGNVTLPANTDTLTVFQGKIIPDPSTEDEVVVDEFYVMLWMEQNTPTWYLGHCIVRNPAGTVKIEHLHRTNCESNFKWKNLNVPDIADIKTEDIIVCKFVGKWDMSNKRMLTYTLKNHEDIDRLVKK